MKQCSYCRGENRDQARFCGHCGQPLTLNAPQQPTQSARSRFSVKGKIFSSFVSGIAAGYLLAVFLPILSKQNVGEVTNKSPAVDKEDQKTLEQSLPSLAVSSPAPSLEETTDRPLTTVDRVAHKSPEYARSKLKEMGLPYIEEAFIGEAEGGNIAAVELFLAAGMNPNMEDPIRGSALLLAAKNGHTETVQVLLTQGADANETNPLGQTALIKASGNGHSAVVKVLLANGAYVNAKDFLGSTALSAARGGKHEETVRVLEKAGARE